jgi:hypothetical protein
MRRLRARRSPTRSRQRAPSTAHRPRWIARRAQLLARDRVEVERARRIGRERVVRGGRSPLEVALVFGIRGGLCVWKNRSARGERDAQRGNAPRVATGFAGDVGDRREPDAAREVSFCPGGEVGARNVTALGEPRGERRAVAQSAHVEGVETFCAGVCVRVGARALERSDGIDVRRVVFGDRRRAPDGHRHEQPEVLRVRVEGDVENEVLRRSRRVPNERRALASDARKGSVGICHAARMSFALSKRDGERHREHDGKRGRESGRESASVASTAGMAGTKGVRKRGRCATHD